MKNLSFSRIIESLGEYMAKKDKKRDKKSVKKSTIRSNFKHIPNHRFEHFLNREESWLNFNDRVLALAVDERTPLLERLRFIDIFYSNLDEYIMKRVGGLKDQIESQHTFMAVDGKSPEKQLEIIRKTIIDQNKRLKEHFDQSILIALKSHKIELKNWKQLNSTQKEHLNQFFNSNLFPILTPLSVDNAHPFPFISNLSKSLAVCLTYPGKKEKILSRIKIPETFPNWIRVPTEDQRSFAFLPIEALILENIEKLFPGMSIQATLVFRITRHVGWDQNEEDAEDLLELIEEAIKERKFSPVIRLEHEKKPNKWILDYLKKELEIEDDDCYELRPLPGHCSFSEIINLELAELKFPPWRPLVPRELMDDSQNIFKLILKKDLLYHHPYENFSNSVERFIHSAAHDPKVLAIKITLYRTDTNGQIVKSLIHAAENGKQVACLIELKARFEEEKNVQWAQEMASVGVHVVYGVTGLKTHSKLALVIRQGPVQLQTFCHIGTGNYNSQTSKLYTDLSFFTCKRSITNEVIQLFNFLTGLSLNKDYENILVAPITMRKKFVKLIEQEIDWAKKGHPARIIAKMNSLEDIRIISKLYEASKAGVKISLIVRGFCCLRPGVKGLSENIEVISILGRFLEHSRVFYFSNGEQKERGLFFLGSADWMYRNLTNRVECITPIQDELLREDLWYILESSLNDQVLAWELQPNGQYQQRRPNPINDTSSNSQQMMMQLSRKRHFI
jgi:polyphosphate kinase